MQVILELDDCSIRVYQSFAEHIQYSCSFSYNHLIRALNHCYQVGQYLKHHTQKRPKILKLCLRVSYNSRIILSKMFTYYSQNYAGIIGAGLTRALKELLGAKIPLCSDLQICQKNNYKLMINIKQQVNAVS